MERMKISFHVSRSLSLMSLFWLTVYMYIKDNYTSICPFLVSAAADNKEKRGTDDGDRKSKSSELVRL